MIDEFEVRLERDLGGFLGIGLEVIDRRDAVEQLKLQVGVGLEVFADLDQASGGDLDPGIDHLEIAAGDLVAELFFEAIEKRLARHRTNVECRNQLSKEV